MTTPPRNTAATQVRLAVLDDFRPGAIPLHLALDHADLFFALLKVGHLTAQHKPLAGALVEFPEVMLIARLRPVVPGGHARALRCFATATIASSSAAGKNCRSRRGRN
jgi:hypothetical protein